MTELSLPRDNLKVRAALLMVLLLVLASALAGCELFSTISGGSAEASAKITIGSAELQPGGMAKVKVTVDIPSGTKLAELQVGPGQALRFDPKVIQINSIIGVGGFIVLASAIENAIGEARFAAVSIYGGVTGGEILELEVEAVGSAGETSKLELTGVDLLLDEAGREIGPVAITNGRVEIK